MSGIKIYYSKSRELELHVPDKNLVLIRVPKSSGPKLATEKMIYQAMENSSGYDYFIKRIDNANNITFIVDDHTRGTPVEATLRFLKNLFDIHHIDWEKVTVLIATGTHRLMTFEELRNKLGDLLNFTKVVQHDCRESTLLESYGEYMGIPIYINKLASADFTLGIGTIVPHRFSGWSGGAKIILPGISGYETIYRSHRMAILQSNVDIGILHNPFRELINEASKRVELDYIINFYYSSEGKIAGCVGGEPVEAHRKGVKLAEKELGFHLEQPADVSIVSSYPSVNDFWQAGKALYVADKVTSEGGKIIMMAPLDDGLGDHPIFGSLLSKEKETILEEMDRKRDDPLAYVAAYAVRKILESKETLIYTRRDLATVFSKFRIPIVDDVQETINATLNGNPNVKIAILPNSLIFPIPKTT